VGAAVEQRQDDRDERRGKQGGTAMVNTAIPMQNNFLRP
jgi:hypothetical protein